VINNTENDTELMPLPTLYPCCLCSNRSNQDHGRGREGIRPVLGGGYPEVSRSATLHLIKTGEEIFGEERLAWQSTSAKNEKVQANAKDEENEGNTGTSMGAVVAE
jgi:hypothetical protein